jgi:hypothetical protein
LLEEELSSARVVPGATGAIARIGSTLRRSSLP